MMHKLTATLLLVLLSLSSLCAVSAQSTDGNSKRIVVPNDYPTIQEAIDQASPGDTVYVKKGIYEGCLSINKSLSLMGEDKTKTTIKGDWTLGGTVVLVNHDDVTVSGFTILSSGGYNAGTLRGVHLLNVKNCTVSGCIFPRVGKGIWLYGSSANTIENNIVSGPPYFMWSCVTLEYSSNNIIHNNTFTDAEQGGIELVCSNGNTITGNFVKSRWYGLHITNSNSNIIADNSISGVRCGILHSGAYNSFKNNTITDSLTGIQVNYALYNRIERNTITHSNYCGVEIHNNSSHNRVIGNNISENKYGLEIKDSTNNTLTYNNITGSSIIGAIFTNAQESLIQKNNFINNTQQIFSDQSRITWDNNSVGNYWDTYNSTDTDNNGVGDAHYVIDESNTDHYPLINLIDYTNTVIPETTILSPSSQTQGSSWVLIAVASGTLLGTLACIAIVLNFRKRKRRKTEP